LELKFIDKIRYARQIINEEVENGRMEKLGTGFYDLLPSNEVYRSLQRDFGLKEGSMQHFVKVITISSSCFKKIIKLAQKYEGLSVSYFQYISKSVSCRIYERVFEKLENESIALRNLKENIQRCGDYQVIRESIVNHLKKNTKLMKYLDIKQFVLDNIDDLLTSTNISQNMLQICSKLKKNKGDIPFDKMDYPIQMFIRKIEKKIEMKTKGPSIEIVKNSIYNPKYQFSVKNGTQEALDLMFNKSGLKFSLFANYKTGQVAILCNEENSQIQTLKNSDVKIPINFISIDAPYGITDYPWDTKMEIEEIADLFQTTAQIFKIEDSKVLLFHERDEINKIQKLIKNGDKGTDLFQSIQFKFAELCYWSKSKYRNFNIIPLFNQVEEFLILHNQKNLHQNSTDIESNGNHFAFPAPELHKNSDGIYINSTQKSIELEQFILSNYSTGSFSDQLNIVFCAGTGSSVLASLRTGANVIAFENDFDNFSLMCSLVSEEIKNPKENVFKLCLKHNGLSLPDLLNFIEAKTSKKQVSFGDQDEEEDEEEDEDKSPEKEKEKEKEKQKEKQKVKQKEKEKEIREKEGDEEEENN
jgi:hypothetical protein